MDEMLKGKPDRLYRLLIGGSRPTTTNAKKGESDGLYRVLIWISRPTMKKC